MNLSRTRVQFRQDGRRAPSAPAFFRARMQRIDATAEIGVMTTAKHLIDSVQDAYQLPRRTAIAWALWVLAQNEIATCSTSSNPGSSGSPSPASSRGSN